MAAQRDRLLGALKGLLDTGKYSDLTIICGSDTHKVHKSIVCARCGFFERAERFPTGIEAAESTINLPEDEPAIITLLIEFLYEGDYVLQNWFPHTCETSQKNFGPDEPCVMELCRHHICGVNCGNNCRDFACSTCNQLRPSRPIPEENASQLLVHAKMYEIADKYDVPGLKELSRDRFETACHVYWKEDDFGKAAEYVYTTTPENDHGLRTIVYKAISAHREIIPNPPIQKFLRSRPEVMLKLLTQHSRSV